MFIHNGLEFYDPALQPSLDESKEFRLILQVMHAHSLSKDLVLNRNGEKSSYGHATHCRSCGELPVGTDQDEHVAHQLLVAGIGSKADLLRKTAKDAKDRGDIGKKGGVEPEDYLNQRAVLLQNPSILRGEIYVAD